MSEGLATNPISSVHKRISTRVRPRIIPQNSIERERTKTPSPGPKPSTIRDDSSLNRCPRRPGLNFSINSTSRRSKASK